MVGSEPDPELFRTVIGGAIEKSQRMSGGSPVRAYGEMVDVLCREGNFVAAFEVEELWNELASVHRFALLCGYGMGSFSEATDAGRFQEVCSRHARVMPTERSPEIDDETVCFREIARLQQRARALETEIAARRDLEQALCQARADRDHVRAERERFAERERGARAEAERDSLLKEEFLRLLSHELRTPLNAILGWTHIAIDSKLDEPATRHALSIIDRNAHLQRRVIEDLLDVSRITSGSLRIGADPVGLASVVRAALGSIRSAAQAKDIEVVLQLDDPSGAVSGDYFRLRQVVWNLLSNAVKFTPRGGSVHVLVDRVEADVRLVVRDSGRGIGSEFLPHVFDRFRQEDTGTTRRYGGLGLGLAIVRHLVEAHGGTVSADSAGEGHGATFTVILPLRSSSLV
jgi:signal transduction histidine kinase